MITHNDISDELLGFTITTLDNDELYMDGVIAEVLNHPHARELIYKFYPRDETNETA